MGRPLMIQEDDERRIDNLERRLGIQRKVDVLRAGIELLEKEAERRVLRSQEDDEDDGLRISRALPP